MAYPWADGKWEEELQMQQPRASATLPCLSVCVQCALHPPTLPSFALGTKVHTIIAAAPGPCWCSSLSKSQSGAFIPRRATRAYYPPRFAIPLPFWDPDRRRAHTKPFFLPHVCMSGPACVTGPKARPTSSSGSGPQSWSCFWVLGSRFWGSRFWRDSSSSALTIILYYYHYTT